MWYLEGRILSSKKKAPKKEPEAQPTEVGSIKFSIGEAFRFSLESIRKRFTRALITAFSVLLGIAFMVTILTMGTILVNAEQQPPASYQIWMVVIALLVCGVGIVNSMLMSVTERYKEIGTIKCLGATDTNVLEIFLIEALLLGLLGGVIGAFSGWVASSVIFGFQNGFDTAFTGTVPSIYIAGEVPILLEYLMHIGLAIGVASLLSIGAAAYPAFYAARLSPAEALRYEV
jgi:putative ABC transport system permease protein